LQKSGTCLKDPKTITGRWYKCKYCRRAWKNARPKLNDRGVMEMLEQLEKRMDDKNGMYSRGADGRGDGVKCVCDLSIGKLVR